MRIDYKTKGVCSRRMIIEVENDKVKDVQIIGGCDGNLKGICQLVKGREVDEVISLLKGIRCEFKHTSCPDQLATALMQAKEREDG